MSVNRLLAAGLAGCCVCATLAGPIVVPSNNVGTIVRGPVSGLDWGRPLGSGDFDGDGYEDLVVAASQSFGGLISRVYVIRGGPGMHGAGLIDLSGVAADLTIYGAQANDNLGSSVASGDFNGDGYDDLVVVASTADFGALSGRGIAYLLYGGPDFFAAPERDLAVAGTWDIRFLGPVEFGDMGGALLFGGADTQAAAFGNLNGDQYDDLILGVHLADGQQGEAGRVLVKFGGPIPSGFTINFAQPGRADVEIWGARQLDELGTIVMAGDITGDGLDELILPCEYCSKGLFTSDGAAYVFRGRTTWPSFINLATTSADITIWGGRQADRLGGSGVVADVNGDGVGDLVIAAPDAEPGPLNTQRGDGIIYGLLGGPSYQTGTHLIDFAVASADFIWVGESQQNLGTIVTSGDYNGDGIADLAAAQRFGGPNVNGIVEILLGRPNIAGMSFTANVDTTVRLRGAPNDRIGFSLTTVNLNGDALDEVLFGTPFNNGGAGTVYDYTYVSADADFDGDVDLADFAVLQPCVGAGFSGPPTLPCVLVDFTLDEWVDGDDLSGLVNAWTGPQ